MYILPVPAIAALALAVMAVFGPEILLVTKMRKGTEITPDRKNHVPAPAAVASRWTAPRDKLLPVEGHAAVSAIP
jgi:hypothetical protein